MRFKMVAIFLILFSAPAHAQTHDHLSCKFNLKRGVHTQAFQLKQVLNIERKLFSYPGLGNRKVIVTQGQIPSLDLIKSPKSN